MQSGQRRLDQQRREETHTRYVRKGCGLFRVKTKKTGSLTNAAPRSKPHARHRKGFRLFRVRTKKTGSLANTTTRNYTTLRNYTQNIEKSFKLCSQARTEKTGSPTNTMKRRKSQSKHWKGLQVVQHSDREDWTKRRRKSHTRHRQELPVVQGQSERVDHHHHVETEENQTPECERIGRRY